QTLRMELKTRKRSSAGQSSPSVLTGVRRGGRRRWPWVLGAVAALVLAVLAVARFAWPSATIGVADTGLPKVPSQSFGNRVESISVRDATGAAIPVRARADGTLWPTHRVVAGTKLFVEAVVRRPSWVGWVAGHTQTLRLELTAPSVRIQNRWLRVRP